MYTVYTEIFAQVSVPKWLNLKQIEVEFTLYSIVVRKGLETNLNRDKIWAKLLGSKNYSVKECNSFRNENLMHKHLYGFSSLSFEGHIYLASEHYTHT